jgi:CheY-like chemotaxis protein
VPKILVADDNTNIQKMVSLAFEERGIDVVSVGNGEAAVRRIPDMNPDLVLADIFMPVRNGYEVCEFVKKDNRFSHVPVILLVGAFDPLDEKEARRVGADGVLKKPFVPPDPLIAMVISALEKNPKLAAELAKAKEVVAEPEPQPVVLEAPVKQEIKPLPEYPEPTSPEEAALVYGFGSGKRGKEDPSGEERGPVSLDADEAEDEEAEASGSHDWRRNAMDFEIPEETSKSTAFALDDDASVMFPSEKVVPPKHVRTKEPTAGFIADSATMIAPAAPIVPPPSAPVVPPPAPVAVAPVATAPQTFTAPAAEAPAPPARKAPFEPNEAHDSFLTATMWGAPAAPIAPPAAPVLEAKVVQESAPQQAVIAPPAEAKAPEAPQAKGQEPEPPKALDAAREIEPVADVEQALEIEPVNEVTFPARASHWMDAMSTSVKEAEPREDDWSDTPPQVKLDLDAPDSLAVVEAASAGAPPLDAPLVEAKVVEAPKAAFSAPQEAPVVAAAAVAQVPAAQADDAFFADEAEQPAPASLQMTPVETKSEIKGADPALETSAPVAVTALKADPALMAEPDTSGPIAKDPALVEPPAVRVTPEPLLVDDTAVLGKSSYDERQAETESASDFAFDKPTAPAMATSEDVEEFAQDEVVVDERIPTGPPPNREVLASIPFLTPPPEFLAQQAAENGAARVDDKDVDAVVRKVLEKLEPRLHDLLSQGLLKPLVETILQDEVAKKER